MRKCLQKISPFNGQKERQNFQKESKNHEGCSGEASSGKGR